MVIYSFFLKKNHVTPPAIAKVFNLALKFQCFRFLVAEKTKHCDEVISFVCNFTGDVFKNYCWDDDLINFAGFAFSFTVLFAFPIECMTARSVITQLLGPINHELTVNEHVCVTLFLVLTTYLISITTSCLGAVLELNVS